MAVSIVFVVYGNEAGNRFMGREKKGNLNNRTFLGQDRPADDPRQTRGRPAKNTRKSRGEEILIIGLFWLFITSKARGRNTRI